MFPAFSLIQKEKERVRRIYFDTMHAVGLISIPLAVGTLLLGPYFVHHYYLGKWDGAIVAMQWLVIYGLMRSIAANLGNIYRALGKPQWLTYLALWRFLTMLALLIPAIRWGGIVGVSILSAVVAVIDFGISAWLGQKLLGGSYSEYTRRLGPILLDLAAQRRGRGPVAAHLAGAPPPLPAVGGGRGDDDRVPPAQLAPRPDPAPN